MASWHKSEDLAAQGRNRQGFVTNTMKKWGVEIPPHNDQEAVYYTVTLLEFKKTESLIKNWGMELNRQFL